ncbi:MAG TPA: hypothetical protein VGO84_12615, partial [Burkholderiales bacterium]|nr:hypothetical protein [Burkholderiales bacterium]
MIQNFVGRGKAKTKALGARAQTRFDEHFVLAPVARQHAIEPIAEGIAQRTCEIVEIVGLSLSVIPAHVGIQVLYGF